MNYTTIWHEPRRRYGLSCNDYCVADIVHRLANNPANDSKWCYASRQTLGDMLGLSKVSILKIIDTLVGVGLVEMHPETKQLRTTEAWLREFTDGKESLPIDSGKESLPMVKKVYQSGKESLPMVKKVYQSGKESLPPSVKKVYQSGKESLPYNNIYNNNKNNTYNHDDSGEENFSNNSSIPLEEKGETPPKAPPVPAAPNFNSSQEHGGGAKDNVTIQLWRENVKYTASMTIGDLKDIGFVDFATSRQGERSKLLPIIKNSLSSLVRKWLTNINWQQSIKAPMSTSFAESAVESLSGTSIPVLREKLLDESSYSIQLLINQQIVWDGNVQFVEQKVESRLFSTLTALYPEKMEESTWQEICKYFAPIATSAKPTASQVGPQTNNPPPKGLKAQVAEAAKYTEHPFSEDELFDPVKFAALIEEKNAKLDSDYYYMAVTGWRDKYGKPPQRKVWASVINQFILNDHKKGTLQFKTNNATSNANPAPPVRNSRLKPVGIEPSEQGREFGSW